MTLEHEPYLAYLLRLWPVENGPRTKWRASIQSVSSGEREGFEDLEQLFEFLRDETRAETEKRGGLD